jgi:hypothetical protein
MMELICELSTGKAANEALWKSTGNAIAGG